MPTEYDVLIVDDDAIQANLLQETLQDLGYSARVLSDGSRVLDEVRRAMPRLVILDIIMPGADGLSLCMKLKPIVKAWAANVVIASGKDRSREEPRALKAGASAFMQKPFRVADLRKVLDRFLPPPEAEAPPLRPQAAVKVWGGRGPGATKATASAYGLATPCVTVGLSSGEVLILDAGTGIRECSQMLLATPQVTAATLLVSHYHAAHIEGLQGLPLLGKAGFPLKVMGPMDPELNLADFCRGLGAKAALSPFIMEEQEYHLSQDVVLRVSYMNHPTTTLGFSIEAAGRKIVYCPDAELAAEGEVEVGNALDRLRQFILGADVLLFDSHFAPEDLAAGRGEGHSAWPAVTRLASQGGVRRLVLFHVSRSYSDAQVGAMEAGARSALAGAASSIDCQAAKDGLTIQL